MSEQEIRRILAARLKEYRELSGYTAKEVGDAIGKSEKTISAWEHGRGQPDADMLFSLCKLYGIKNINIFYGMDDGHLELSADERELLRIYRASNADGRAHILSTARLVAGNPAMRKDGANTEVS